MPNSLMCNMRHLGVKKVMKSGAEDDPQGWNVSDWEPDEE